MSTPFPLIKVERGYTFRAWHHLPRAGSHMAKRPHWHDYKFWVILESEVNPNGAGWAQDFDALDAEIEPLCERLDQQDLNQVMSFPPTSEMLACWLLAQFPLYITGVRVAENGYSSSEILRKNIKHEWLEQFRDDLSTREFMEKTE